MKRHGSAAQAGGRCTSKPKAFNLDGWEIPGTKFRVHKDILLSRDIFVLQGSEPLFVLDCSMHAPYVSFPSCSVRKKILGHLLLDYRYDRSFVDRDLNVSIKIDLEIRDSIESFLKQTPRVILRGMK